MNYPELSKTNIKKTKTIFADFNQAKQLLKSFLTFPFLHRQE